MTKTFLLRASLLLLAILYSRIAPVEDSIVSSMCVEFTSDEMGVKG